MYLRLMSVRGLSFLALSLGISAWPLASMACGMGARKADQGCGTTCAGDHHAAAKAPVDVAVKAYLAVGELLAQDKLDGVEAQLAKIRNSAKLIADSSDAKAKEQAQAILKAIEAEPKTIKEARAAFKPLSAAVIALVKVVPVSADAVPALYEASCPMAKANWLQASKDLANPYMGKEMLDCGKIEGKVEAKSSGHQHH